MRHKLAYRKLNRTSEHRKALFKNMLNSLIKYEQIITTLPKAKELKPKIDKVITLGKRNNLQSKKDLFEKLQSKPSVDKISKIPFIISLSPNVSISNNNPHFVCISLIVNFFS